MENKADWLASNKTWKKWTTIGVGELLSYAGIDFKKPTDEEQLVKEIKRRKKLNDMKLVLEKEVPTELKVLLTLTGTLTSLLKHTTEDPAPGCLSRRCNIKMIYFKL